MENKKLNILGVLPVSIGGRLTTSSILDGFRQLGHNVSVFDELSGENFCAFYAHLDEKQDLIVGYDFSPIELKHNYELSMKCVSYFSDEIRSRASGPNWEDDLKYLNEEDIYIFYWDRELVKQENFKNIFYLPHFVNTEIYKNLNLEFEIDVMFAGRLDSGYRLDTFVSLVESLPDVKFGWYAIEKHYNDALSRVSNKDTIKKVYRGFIDNEEDMAREINKSKIVINMNSQGISSLNYRTMQTIACGKLLISDERAELDLFDKKIPTYNSVEELRQLIRYYLDNLEEYENVASYCLKVCRTNYSSINGIRCILSKLEA